MKFIIAVFQEKEDIYSRLDSLRQERREIAEVGPFSSKSQAMEWMEYMEEKLKPAQVERYAVGCLNPSIWYGATFKVDGEESQKRAQHRESRADALERRVVFSG